jgi:hypothetical protein
MKRGEVVDAETAEKIAEEMRHMDNYIRPIIWPARKADQAETDWDISLEGFPVRRPLAHLVCQDDDIFCLASITIQNPYDDYWVMTTVRMYDYDGNFIVSELPILWTQTEQVARKMRKIDPHPENIFSIEQMIGICERDELAEDISEKWERLGMAICYERFAFSPYTTIKQRPVRKMLASPFPREWPVIEIVNLRLPEKKEPSETTGRSINLRFPVIEHKRRQPTKSGIKLITIPAHWRGPKDAPVKPKIPKVYKVIK